MVPIIGRSATRLVKSARPTSPMVTRIHGLAEQDVAEMPAFAAIDSEVRQAVLPGPQQ